MASPCAYPACVGAGGMDVAASERPRAGGLGAHAAVVVRGCGGAAERRGRYAAGGAAGAREGAAQLCDGFGGLAQMVERLLRML